ncbi:hypothetical protein UFOVP569_29 [uncultured Caudovirales phage]|uniref:Homeodomain phBC6A51-type domain-containing protein n=1 Tax=uncultured Caudovirales phage TaxID=2100421 RepID=A0A6J5RS50_9CAUD|nr:hypothetical protein UFOVP569_29 [uncultured Caudovirales phage]CAB4182877.1 hypothetical protein UFOVP1093_22 [uncultured Caudovirales phage]CAB4199969.1 hypothetical protein UFOVP1340_21 [uncultured Caudovirales phage]CAB4213356.1 hypothetical protein UFOVP1448_2 [uncultured Caudovirales phage]CAB4218657.1 hypothetical protein UFOVP1600_28 [uncultured Caudovirales phage]
MAGRPTKYNIERVQKIMNALSAGNTRRDSCAYAGISEDTFASWLKDKPDFSDSIEKAEADAAVRNVSIIAKAAQEGTWQAAAWWLERRRKQDWAIRHELTGPDAGPLKIIVEYTKESF